MLSDNAIFLFTIALFVLSVHYLGYLIYFRIKHKTILAKHKPGSAIYKGYLKLLEPKRLFMGIAALVVAMPLLTFSTLAVMRSSGTHGFLLAGPIVVILFYVALLFVAYGKKKGFE